MTIKKYFCFELLTAGLVVGWLGLVKSATTTASLITMLIDPDYYISYDSFSSIPPMTVRSSKCIFMLFFVIYAFDAKILPQVCFKCTQIAVI